MVRVVLLFAWFGRPGMLAGLKESSARFLTGWRTDLRSASCLPSFPSAGRPPSAPLPTWAAATSTCCWCTDLPAKSLPTILLAYSLPVCSASAERTIADLGCGHLDLLLVHWPCAWKPGTQEVDTEVTVQQTW